MSFLFRYLRFHDIIGGIHVPVDDGVDKLNRKYTLLVFLFLALPIFTKQYIGDPIECFAPVYFAEHQARYINSYCWTQSTYYIVNVGPEDDGDQQEPPDRVMPDELDYSIGFDSVTVMGNERMKRVRVNYYQWAPLILLAQGLCFYIPFLIWNSCANNAGVKLRRLLKKASDIASLPPGCQQREALLAEFVDQFHTLVTGEAGWCADLQCGGGGDNVGVPAPTSGSSSSASSNQSAANGAQQQPGGVRARGAQQQHQHQQQQQQQQQQQDERAERHSSHHNGHERYDPFADQTGCCLVSVPIIGPLLACCFKPCPTFGLIGPSKYLSLLYLAVKFAYVFNVGLQFFLLGQFIGHGYWRHGLDLLGRIFTRGEWWSSPRFPLTTLCQVRADMSGGLRAYTCQCVLPINVFNEKIFTVVWFYMAFLLPLNVISLLFWIYRTYELHRISYIRLCLWRTRLVELNQIHRTVRRLSKSYLGWDGVFLLRLIEHNHGSIMATLIMSRLWEFYANQMKLQEDANQLALANNAHNTLSNLTASGPGGPGGGGGGGGGGGHAVNGQHQQHHGPPHSHHHSHGHSLGGHHHGPGHPVQPQQQQQQQQQFGHPGANHHHHAHVLQHGHSALAAAAHFGAPLLQPIQAGQQHFASGQQQQQQQQQPPPPPPPPLVPTGHHSGQISQAPGHHPLHAANTAAAHSHALAAHHAHAHAHAAVHQPHMSGASLLAQLHQQHHQTGAPAQTMTTTTTTNQQATAAGNVAAAVAALAAAAAATNHSQPPGSNNLHSIPSNNNQSQSSSSHNNSTTTTTTATSSSNNSNSSSSSNAASSSTVNAAGAGINLHSLKTQGASGAGGVVAAGPATTTTAGGSTSTTSFITQASGTGLTPAGPPLPPPPPAHVVAAVAAVSAAPSQSPAAVRPIPLAGRALAQQQQSSGLFNLKSSTLQQQQHAPGVVSASSVVAAPAARFATSAQATGTNQAGQPSTNSPANANNSSGSASNKR